MKRLLPPALAIPLALAGCGASDFEDEEHKRSAFEQHICSERSANDVNYGTDVSVSVMADEYASAEDKKEALALLTYDPSVIDYSWETHRLDPSYEPMTSYKLDPEGDGNCYGWVWEKHLEDSSEDYAEFTYEDAQEAGVVE